MIDLSSSRCDVKKKGFLSSQNSSRLSCNGMENFTTKILHIQPFHVMYGIRRQVEITMIFNAALFNNK